MSVVSAARACALLLCLAAVSHQITLTEFKVPSQAEAGENVKLICQYTLDEDDSQAMVVAKWWWTPWNAKSDKKKLLYQRIDRNDPKSLLPSDEVEIQDNDSIVLLNVDPLDSGTYECEIGDINEVRQHQELIVYTRGSGPQLNLSTTADGPDEDDEEDVLAACEARGVAPAPELAITVAGKVISMSELVDELDDGYYNIFANATVGKDEAEGNNVRCELLFKNFNVSHPKFFDEKVYDPTGDDASTTTETTEDAAATDAWNKSVENISDGTSQLDISWTLLLTVAIPIHLLTLL